MKRGAKTWSPSQTDPYPCTYKSLFFNMSRFRDPKGLTKRMREFGTGGDSKFSGPDSEHQGERAT